MAEGGEKVQIHRGLQGVHLDCSRVCNILIRALTLYHGPARRDYVAIDAR